LNVRLYTIRLMSQAQIAFLAIALAIAAPAAVVKRIAAAANSPNLLQENAWRGFGDGFAREGDTLACDNGAGADGRRGASQTVVLNQTAPAPIVAEAWSRAERVDGTRDTDYSLYLDLVYVDGTPLWGQTASFQVGTHDWERRSVVVRPSKPVKTVTLHLLLRKHAGKAWFRGAALRQLTGSGAVVFDGVPVIVAAKLREGFQVRDVGGDGNFVDFDAGGKAQSLDLKLTAKRQRRREATIVDAQLRDDSGKDRAVTLVYTLPVTGAWRWLADPRTTTETVAPNEYAVLSQRGRTGAPALSRWPFAAIAHGEQGWLLGIDAGWPAVYRCGYNAGTGELFLAFDVGLAPEQPSAHLRLVKARFDGRLGFRGALQRYFEIFPEYFRNRTPQQGVWMPFYQISKVEGWEDFGFRFKEGNNETEWDDAHGILTFRYTEPMTWWMPMPKTMPRTLEAAVGEARRLAGAGNPNAQALFTSGFHGEDGHFAARLLNTPWTDGAVWSMNSLPGISGEATDWLLKWGPQVREKFYGPGRKGDLDGEYIDSSEGYVTDELDFRRDHFAAARLPLTFSVDSGKPAISRGLIASEYTRRMAEEVHEMGKLMMANGTPNSLCWLAPWLDVLGTETDWNPPADRGAGRAEAKTNVWSPMGETELLYRRAICGPKPYCFLMNTRFTAWTREMTGKFMKRCLAYGMFPGFFSADASTGHYFSQPALYNRDRALFKQFIPLCRRVAEAGWQPLTKAHSDQRHIVVERFGDRLLTVFNGGVATDSTSVVVSLDGMFAGTARELVTGQTLAVRDGRMALTLGPEDVALLELR
jgi:hypothetical protein